jgi:hypothetical protein
MVRRVLAVLALAVFPFIVIPTALAPVASAAPPGVSLVDLASSSPFTGMATFSQPPDCYFAKQTFDAAYPGSTSVGTVTLHIAGCADPFQTMSFNSGSFTITTNVGALSGTASGPVTLTSTGGSLSVLFELTLSVVTGTGSFAGTTGGLQFVTLYPASAPSTFVGTVTVPDQLQITTKTLPDGTIGQPYSFQLEATGGLPPYSWNKYPPKGNGVLPFGLSLSKSGLISGIPKRTGTFIITVKCLDSTHSHKRQGVQTLTLSINPS